MPNKNSEAFEIALKSMIIIDILHAKRSYEYLVDCSNRFNNKKLSLYLLDLADVHMELYKVLCDKFFKRYGVYPQL